MTQLVITEGGAILTCHRERIQLRREGRIVHEVRLQELEGVMATASLGLTAQAVRRLLRAGIDVVFLDERGRLLGRLLGPSSGNIALRQEQIRLAGDEGFRLGVARRIVSAKLSNQRWLLLRNRRRHAGAGVGEAASRLRLLAEQAARASDLAELLGIEGAGAQLYFSVFGALIVNPLFTFGGRSRRPPRDPVNAMLSFGYTVLGTLAEGEAAAAGLDPMAGFLHAIEYNRPSLALDLIEELRPVVVDALVLRLVNRRQVAPADFGPPPGPEGDRRRSDPWLEDAEAPEWDASRDGVYLSRTGRPVFLRAFHARLKEEVLDPALGRCLPLREVLRRRARAVALAIREHDPDLYQPFRLPG